MERPMRRLRTRGSPAGLGHVGDLLNTGSGVLGGVGEGLDVGDGVHGGGADPGEAAHGGDGGDDGEPEHVKVVGSGLLETRGVVHKAGGDVLVHVEEDGARGGGKGRHQLDVVGHGGKVGDPGAVRGGRERVGERQRLEGEAVVAREPLREDDTNADRDGGREVTDDVADALGAVGGRLKLEMATPSRGSRARPWRSPWRAWRRCWS